MTTPSTSTSNHAITSDGSTHHYHLRSLQITTSEEGREHHTDITRWTKFCASVFSYKPNPPPASYFARHYYNDPRCDPALVRVLIYKTPHDAEIVSSVRIFRRTLSTAGNVQQIEAGGIGEVCTSPNHQRRGLSKILLKDAIQIMSSSCQNNKENGMSCSLLHANPEFRSVYAKVGNYASVSSKWSLVPIQLQQLSSEKISIERISNDWQIRPAKFPQDADQLQQLHSEYSERRLITVVRSVRYWKDYVSAELGDTLWVLTKPSTDDGDENIVAWISIRQRGDRYQLREFGVKKQGDNAVSTHWAMERLLGVALDQAGEVVGSEQKEVSLLLPTFVLGEIKDEISSKSQDGGAATTTLTTVDKVTEENDDGWMYVNFDETKKKPSVLELTTREVDPVLHLIWPTDSF